MSSENHFLLGAHERPFFFAMVETATTEESFKINWLQTVLQSADQFFDSFLNRKLNGSTVLLLTTIWVQLWLKWRTKYSTTSITIRVLIYNTRTNPNVSSNLEWFRPATELYCSTFKALRGSRWSETFNKWYHFQLGNGMQKSWLVI